MGRGVDDIALKILPPKPVQATVVRDRLALASSRFSGKSVIVVQAPGGFGKTQLLVQWYAQAWRRSEVAAWLTLDDRDDGRRFIDGLAASMDMAQGRPAFRAAVEQAQREGADLGTQLKRWLAQIAALGCETMLVLDCAHRLPPSTVTGTLAELLLGAPPNLRVVLATRESLSLPSAELIACGRYEEVTECDLSFEIEESCELFRLRFGSRRLLDHCARLHELTAGWPLGVQLGMSERGEMLPESPDGVGEPDFRCKTVHRFIESALVELPSEVKEFLMRVSVLAVLDPQACEAVTAVRNSGAFLERLFRETSLFFRRSVSCAGEFQPLIRLCLQALMESSDRRMAHEHAALWFGSKGQHLHAIHHAMNAERPELAMQHLESACALMLEQGRPDRVVRWLDRLLPRAFGRCPRVARLGAWAHARFGRPELAQPWLGAAQGLAVHGVARHVRVPGRRVADGAAA